MAETTYRPQFVEALKLLASAFADVEKAGFSRPVLVGGAVVEFYTGGNIVSGDFDVVTIAQQELEQALIDRGFQRHGLRRGVLHPQLGIGVEVVSGRLFDGASDRARVRLVAIGDRGEAVPIPPVEDIIADRMGQYCANPSGHKDMLEQAVVLYRIACADIENPSDEQYLETRIRHETANTYGVKYLKEKANDPDIS